jgi:NAD-dependent dihydropyrimidine dehydrogenase PreA subunit
MVYINHTTCNGCGDCIDVCPNGALVIQNNRAFINDELCAGCEVCVDACSKGAILTSEYIPSNIEIQIPEIAANLPSPLTDESDQKSFGKTILPTIGSAIVWTGRELVPRLADIALEYLDQKIQNSQNASYPNNASRQGGRAPNSSSRNKHRRLRQRYRKKSF